MTEVFGDIESRNAAASFENRILLAEGPIDLTWQHASVTAEFLGDTNFLKGTVADGALRLSDGTLIRTGAPLPATGAAAMVAVRPEKMRIVAADGAGDGAENRLSARIDHVIYAGPALTYALTASDGTALKIFAQNSTGAIHAEGSDVSLVWQPAHTIPMEDAA